jgi:hypothetical protein
VDNIKMDFRERGWGGLNRTDLAQDRDQWRALVNTVMNLGFHKILSSSSVAVQLPASEAGLSSTKLVNEVHILNRIWC